MQLYFSSLTVHVLMNRKSTGTANNGKSMENWPELVAVRNSDFSSGELWRKAFTL
jgi:hypothetical protein